MSCSNQATACLPVCLPASLSPSRPPGAVFDRQASVRRSLINTDTVSRRPKKVKRRKTISGLPDNINLELGMVHCGASRHVAPCCPQTCTQHSGTSTTPLLPSAAFCFQSNLTLKKNRKTTTTLNSDHVKKQTKGPIVEFASLPLIMMFTASC